jgi:hypothetical protein
MSGIIPKPFAEANGKGSFHKLRFSKFRELSFSVGFNRLLKQDKG